MVVLGEFGRSPQINTKGPPGRLHWPQCYSAILAGGGIRGGMVYGQSDKIGAYVKENPVRPAGSRGRRSIVRLDVLLEVKLGKDGVSNPITTGQPIYEFV